MSIINCTNRAFSRDLDVDVQVSKPQTEQTTDLSVLVAVVKTATFSHGADRIRYYSSLASVEGDFATTTEAWKMANAFFAQTPRAQTMAIAKAFETAQAGFMTGADLGELTAFQAISDGEFEISIDGVSADISGLDFSADTSLDDVATTIQTALQAVATGGFTASTAVNNGGRILITSGTTGDLSTVSFLSTLAVPAGTDVSGALYINARQGNGVATDGYTPTGIAGELALIAESATCSGRFVYGWALEASYRDTTDQEDASTWAQGRTAILGLVSNAVSALDASFTTDIGSVTNASGDFRTFNFWSDQPDEYPEVALLSYALHVNYQAENSTITTKFKDLIGITASAITESELTILQNKRYNVLTRVGNSSRTVRDGVEANDSWFIDDLINLDNFKEELQVAVYNVFLREKKVPYTEGGVALIRLAIRQICTLYVLNGTFAERRIFDDTREAGFRVDPAFTITSTALELIPVADRAGRIGPPFTVDAFLAGAIHEVAIDVNAFS